MKTLEDTNNAIEQNAPEIWRCLSPLARASVYPPDIPFQAAQARGKRYNATIGQITDGAGKILALPLMADALGTLSEEERNRALLYSAVPGHTRLRELWAEYHRPEAFPGAPATLPIVTVGLTQSLAMVADLFGGPGRVVLATDPCWGNYEQVFALRTGADLRLVPIYEGDTCHFENLARAADELPGDDPALLILNIPSNPGGYSPTPKEREVLVGALLESAKKRPLVVLFDDAYSGLVYEPGIPSDSLFWELAGKSERLLAIRAAGATKEFSFFGGRVGFLTFGLDPENPAALALDNKARCLLRANVGSPVGVSQVLLQRTLESDQLGEQQEGVRAVLEARWRAMVEAVSAVSPEVLRLMPSNSGAFGLVRIADGVDPEELRHHLLEHHDTGIVSVPPCFVRIAFCSVSEQDLPELVARIEGGVRDLL